MGFEKEILNSAKRFLIMKNGLTHVVFSTVHHLDSSNDLIPAAARAVKARRSSNGIVTLNDPSERAAWLSRRGVSNRAADKVFFDIMTEAAADLTANYIRTKKMVVYKTGRDNPKYDMVRKTVPKSRVNDMLVLRRASKKKEKKM